VVLVKGQSLLISCPEQPVRHPRGGAWPRAARQRGEHWRDHLDTLRSLVADDASASDRPDTDGGAPPDPVQAARQRRAARRQARQQAAEGQAGSSAEPSDPTARSGTGRRREAGAREARGGEVTEELFNTSSGWAVEALGDSEDDEARPRPCTWVQGGRRLFTSARLHAGSGPTASRC